MSAEKIVQATERPEPNPGTYLTRRQVAARWNCCEHTVARNKLLKAKRFSARMLRYSLEDVMAVEAGA